MVRMLIQLGRSKIILALIVSIGCVMGYLGYSQLDDPTIGLFPVEGGGREDIESLRNIKIDFSILDDERYKSLEIFGENPVDLGITGERINPFEPIR